MKRVLKGARLLDPALGLDEPGGVVIEDGAIARVFLEREGAEDMGGGDRVEVEDLDGRWLVPGLVDLRCWLGEPGHEERETVTTGLSAAAAGGYTAVCAMPDTDPIADGSSVVAEILAVAERAGGARLLPVGAATAGLQHETLAPMGELAEAGCVAVDCGGKPVTTARLMRRVLEYASVFELPVFTTAVDPTLRGDVDEGIWSTRLGLAPSPAEAEYVAVIRELALAELTGSRLHLSRISTARALEAIAAARERGVAVTCDVTPMHFTLTVAALQGFDPSFKVWPPLRSEADREAIRAGLASGLIDAVASDHRPTHTEDKNRPYAEAAVGISAIETSLSLVLRLVQDGVLKPSRAIELLSSGPRGVLGDAGHRLEAGCPADLTVIDPDATWIPERASLRSKSLSTPFLGEMLRGRAAMTIVGGNDAWRLQEG